MRKWGVHTACWARASTVSLHDDGNLIERGFVWEVEVDIDFVSWSVRLLKRRKSSEGEEWRTLYNCTALLVIHWKPTLADLTSSKEPIKLHLLATCCALCAVFCTPPARFVRSGVVARGPIRIVTKGGTGRLTIAVRRRWPSGWPGSYSLGGYVALVLCLFSLMDRCLSYIQSRGFEMFVDFWASRSQLEIPYTCSCFFWLSRKASLVLPFLLVTPRVTESCYSDMAAQDLHCELAIPIS